MKEPKKLKIAIIQLTRIGDLIQTAQATRQFRAENPNTEITLIARRKFSSGIKFFLETVFDEIIEFDIKDFLQQRELKDATSRTRNFVDMVKSMKFDVSVNLSFNKSSSYLSQLLDCKLKLGLTRNNRNEVSITDRWSQFVYSNVMNSSNNPFSLVDIYRYILGCDEIHVLEDDNKESREKIIVLHPFASTKKKRWGTHKWNELVFKLAKDNPDHTIHIVGGPEDHNEAMRIYNSPSLLTHQSRIEIHAGKSSIEQTYGLLTKAQLFVGHDSLVSHIASETLTPSIVISLGTVRPHETTAYAKNVINIMPRNKCFPCQVTDPCESLPCHTSVNHQSIAVIAKGLLNNATINEKFLKNNIPTFHIDNLTVFSSLYGHYGLELKKLSSEYMSSKEVFQDFYKVIWQCYLRNFDINAALPEISKDTASQLYKYKDVINYLIELYNFGLKYTNKIINEVDSDNPNINFVKENIAKLGEIDELCNITKKSYPLLGNLVDYFFVAKANSIGDNILEISKSNLILYYDASNLASVLAEFIDKSIAPHIARNMDVKEV